GGEEDHGEAGGQRGERAAHEGRFSLSDAPGAVASCCREYGSVIGDSVEFLERTGPPDRTVVTVRGGGPHGDRPLATAGGDESSGVGCLGRRRNAARRLSRGL